MKEVVPKLPEKEKYDLTDQPVRACKSTWGLIAGGYAKGHQKAGFQKYGGNSLLVYSELVSESSEKI